eukprot:CAMPEP_0167828062 /NCGR_PEP_ID=MMETSP0112_2-20121227/11136_1 /TAXON_ID=91324 /ORGANISM="Lotharella globosa, Strain CCCM811" /LENGTH=170 /DNA_ID=CAMNT_0007731085 /DNA_START=41 /DNA_END=550 /DNA_ORIENTATION=+
MAMDVHSNPFFQYLDKHHQDTCEKLFVGDNWMLVLPKPQPNHRLKMSLELVLQHVLRPCEATQKDSNKYQNLKDHDVEVTDSSIRNLANSAACKLLRTETYYDDDFRSFLVLHTNTPLLPTSDTKRSSTTHRDVKGSSAADSKSPKLSRQQQQQQRMMMMMMKKSSNHSP